MLSDSERRRTIDRCHEAARMMRALDARMPGEPSFASIIVQLDHVAGALTAGQSPLVPGKSLNFGFLGMKFVREFDPNLSRELAELNELIDKTFGTGAN